MAQNAYDIDGFRTLTLRACKPTAAAFQEGLQDLHYGDAVTLVVTGVTGCVPSELLFGVYDKDSAVLNTAAVWAFVPGTKDRVYANFSLATAAALAAVAGVALGKSVEIRIYLCENGGRTLLDVPIDFYPNPASPGGESEAVLGFVTKAQLAQLAQDTLDMDAFNAAQREARFIHLLQGLVALTTP